MKYIDRYIYATVLFSDWVSKRNNETFVKLLLSDLNTPIIIMTLLPVNCNPYGIRESELTSSICLSALLQFFF